MSISDFSGLRAGIAGLPFYIYYKNNHGEILACSDRYAKLLDKSDQFTFLKNHQASLSEVDAFGYDFSALTEISQGRSIELTINGDVKLLQVQSSYIDALSAWSCCGYEVPSIARKPIEKIETKPNLEKSKPTDRVDLAENDQLTPICLDQQLRMPLTVVLNLAAMLIDKVQDETAQDYVRQIFCYAHRFYLSAINGFVLLERKVRMLPVACDVIELELLFQELIEMGAEMAKHKALLFDFSYPKEMPKVIRQDKFRLEIILRNLMNNAAKFAEKGAVKLSVELDAQENKLKFYVSDTGVGMPANINLQFDQVNQKQNPALGLVVVKQFVSDLSGVVYCDSAQGQGSVVTVELPYIANQIE